MFTFQCCYVSLFSFLFKEFSFQIVAYVMGGRVGLGEAHCFVRTVYLTHPLPHPPPGAGVGGMGVGMGLGR